jgi:hypothetical protein
MSEENKKKSFIDKLKFWKFKKFWLYGSLLFGLSYFPYVFWTSLPAKQIDVTLAPEKQSLFVHSMVENGLNQLDNWTPNDITIPLFMRDDIVHYQEGVWRIFRENAIILREEFSRNRTSGAANDRLIKVYNLMAIDTRSWVFPNAEKEYRKAIKELRLYNNEVAINKALFRPAADNLPKLLKRYISVMGDISTKLNNSSTTTSIDEDKGGHASVQVGWLQIDDNFYKAQGVADAMLWSMKGVKKDFAKILEDKNGTVIVDKIIQDLQRCSFRPPMVLNGDPHSAFASTFANHSLSLSSYIQHVRNRMASLHDMLENG